MPYRDDEDLPPSRFDEGDTVLVTTPHNGVFIGRVAGKQWHAVDGWYYDVPRNPREIVPVSLYGEDLLSPYGASVS